MRARTVIALFALSLNAAPQQPSLADAMALGRKGQYFDAERALKDLLRTDAGDAAVHAALGELYYRFGHYEAAVPALSKAIELRPADRQSRIWKAVCLFKLGQADAAVATTRELLAETPPPNDIDLSLTYAEYLYQQRDLEEALKQTRAAIAFAPRHPVGYFWLARLLLEKRQLDEAAGAAERSVALAPELPFARNLLVRIYRMEGRAADSEKQAAWIRDYENRKAVR
jgi:tetratricopeptide (TPR) repeat protein